VQEIPKIQKWSLFLAVTALLLMLAQPLWAVEESSTPQGKQEESVFETTKRKAREWMNGDSNKAQEEAPQEAEIKSQTPTQQKSDGRKAIDTVKKRMNKISDNVSESIDRDKKTLKKKLDTLVDPE
jgi:flagellum-specific peptidoglycan hydrolase FlgJ